MNNQIFHTLMGIDLRNINMFPNSVHEEILQNVMMLLRTIRGTVPLDRDLGLTNTFIDDPSPRGMMRFAIFVLETIQEYEPRVEVTEVDFAPRPDDAMDGRLHPRVVVRIFDEYIT
ncbi:MAG: hypothetical protein FWC66_08530 [Oscillospiraceae bacterium]|nr:hypothetical protein [Oscillospiraceae bacterium]